MNKENNRRYQETDEQLIRACTELLTKKEPEQITVSELCRMVGINRSSFYLHYRDVYDMTERIEDWLAQYFAELFTGDDEHYDLGERFQRMFAFIREHQTFYRIFFRRNQYAKIFDAALPLSAEESLAKLTAELGYQSEREYAYHQCFFRAGFAALLKAWVDNGCIETPEELSDILGREYAGASVFKGMQENQKY